MSRYGEALFNLLKDNPKPELTTSDIHKSIVLLQEAIFKANMYDKLSSDLGCPLDVVFKAFEKGIIFHIEEYDVIIDGEYITIIWETKELKWNNDKGRVFLKDYKKTWWLKEDKTE